MSYIAENPKDIFRDFQVGDEGDVIADVTKFGAGFQTNPTLKHFGKNQRFEIMYSPVGFPIQTLSDENRKEIIVVKNSAKITVNYDITDYTYNGDLSWLLELHKNDFKSRAGFFSRKPQSTEYFKKFYGIVPMKTDLIWPDAGDSLVHATVELLATLPIQEDTTGPIIGTGSYAPAIATAALKASDAGNNSFAYNSVNSKTHGMQISVSPIYQVLEPDEAQNIQHMRPVSRDMSGIVKVYKKQGADLFHADIFTQTLRSMSKVIKPSPTGTKINMTDVQISPEDKDSYSSISSDSNIKEYRFTMGGLSLENLA